MDLRAEKVPHSSIVGTSVSLQNEAGAVVALVIISVPSPSFPYRETAEPIAERIMEAFNPEVPLRKRPIAFILTDDEGAPRVYTNEAEAAKMADVFGVEYHGLYQRQP